MAGDKTKSWREVRAERPLNEARLAVHRRLMDAQLHVAENRRRRGIGEATIEGALADSEENVDEEDLYLSTLARCVAALGGHIEIQAVFPDETVTVLRAPPN